MSEEQKNDAVPMEQKEEPKRTSIIVHSVIKIGDLSTLTTFDCEAINSAMRVDTALVSTTDFFHERAIAQMPVMFRELPGDVYKTWSTLSVKDLVVQLKAAIMAKNIETKQTVTTLTHEFPFFGPDATSNMFLKSCAEFSEKLDAFSSVLNGSEVTVKKDAYLNMAKTAINSEHTIYHQNFVDIL